ncbi:putative atp-dependent rna helicase rok1 [Phaeomoniella chlamydospora]|uniref:ATP-dependent RNA helicase ROK1 n=1 Tax=Phaeomoniella chlamydospora TaxID=158046 RepID=A0A0G2GVZ1_PHACM|nr:putative atp-dependent rna helicase rok1 [Phaeomoniella chlamydospora]
MDWAENQLRHLLQQTWSLEDRRKILKSHKIKITNLTSLSAEPVVQTVTKKSKKKHVEAVPPSRKKIKEAARVYPQPLTKFGLLQPEYNVSTTLARNISEQGYYIPTEVQLAALPLLLGGLSQDEPTMKEKFATRNDIDLLTVAPTGSGKTIAFLIPLIHHLSRNRDKAERHVSAIILAPTKELVSQIVVEGRKLCAKTGVHISAMRKGMSLDASSNAFDEIALHEEPHGGDEEPSNTEMSSVVKSDILVSTPLLLSNSISSKKLPNVKHLILDEADVLLDPLFRDQTLSVWNACTNQSLRTSFWSATIGASIEDLVKAILATRQRSVSTTTPPAPLIRLVIGLKDTSLPNITHRLIYAATEPGKLLGLRQLLHPTSSSSASTAQSPLRPPFLVFTQTITRAIALHSELRYDIPLPAGGSSRIAVLHSDLSDSARSDIMTRFRKAQIWVLITTDLLARGIDFRGVNGVVNYDIPTSSAGYVHRAGRTGRAGREGGVVVTFYTKEDIQYVKPVANVIAASEKLRDQQQQLKSPGQGPSNHDPKFHQQQPQPRIQKWLLDALPNVSKSDRQRLKKRGIETRRSAPLATNTTNNDASQTKKQKREIRQARISTKSGFDRKMEGRKRGAREGSKKRKEMGVSAEAEGNEEGEWGGFED